MEDSSRWIVIVELLSRIMAALVAGFAAKERARHAVGWAVASFFLYLPVLVVLQSPLEKTSQTSSPRWPTRFATMAIVFAIAVIVGEVQFGSLAAASGEAQLARLLNPGQALFANGPQLESKDGILELHGSLTAPISLGIAGMGLGALIVHQTITNVFKMAAASSMIGLLNAATTTQVAVRDWLKTPNDIPEPSNWPTAVSSIVILWSSVLIAWRSARSRAA